MGCKGMCDGCGKVRGDVRSCGRDSNGDPDAPDLCFICRKEGEKGRVYNFKLQRYVYPNEAIEGIDYTEKDIPF